MNAMDRRLIAHANWGLVGCTVLLFTVGIVNLYSASSVRTEDGYQILPFFEKQIIWAIAGLTCMLVCASFDYRHIKTLALPIFLISIVLLALVPPFGVVVNNAKRWLSFGLFNLQPSEIAKISVLLMASVMLSKHSKPLGWGSFIGILLVCSVPCMLILSQPDLGTTLNLLLLVGGMILFTGIRMSVFIPCLIGFPILAYLAWFTLLDYQKERVYSFINPAKASAKAIYHISQSKITIGSGRMWGNSFLEGTQSKLRFLPEKHTDFAIAVFGEEWGFVGTITLMTLFCLFLLSIIVTTRDAKDRLGSTLCAGVFFYFFWQILINIGMVVGLMPVVGIPLPFISYGGTAMIVNGILLGFVLNVSMRRFMFKSH